MSKPRRAIDNLEAHVSGFLARIAARQTSINQMISYARRFMTGINALESCISRLKGTFTKLEASISLSKGHSNISRGRMGDLKARIQRLGENNVLKSTGDSFHEPPAYLSKSNIQFCAVSADEVSADFASART